jgi:hypothetical protein
MMGATTDVVEEVVIVKVVVETVAATETEAEAVGEEEGVAATTEANEDKLEAVHTGVGKSHCLSVCLSVWRRLKSYRCSREYGNREIWNEPQLGRVFAAKGLSSDS